MDTNTRRPAESRPPNDAAFGRNLRIAAIMLLGGSLLAQTITLTTPGWQVIENESSSFYMGIFYTTICETPYGGSSTCTTTSNVKLLQDEIDATESDANKISTGQRLRIEIFGEVKLLIVWVFTALSILLLACGLRGKTPPMFVTGLFLIPELSISAAIMFDSIYQEAIYVDTLNKIRGLGDKQNLSFPYGYFCYILGFVLLLVTAGVLSKLIKDELLNRQIYSPNSRPRSPGFTVFSNV